MCYLAVVLFFQLSSLYLSSEAKMIMYKSTYCDIRNPRKIICSFKMEVDDFVNITYPLGFAIDQTIPEMRSRCNSSLELCAKETGTSEFTLEGTFNGTGITRIVFSEGVDQATLFIQNVTDKTNPVTPGVNTTDPAVLKVRNFQIESATPVSLPFITKHPDATAYEGEKAVASVFGLPTDLDCKYNYVCVTKTGGNSTIHLEGAIDNFPTTFEVIAMDNKQSVVFIFNSQAAVVLPRHTLVAGLLCLLCFLST